MDMFFTDTPRSRHAFFMSAMRLGTEIGLLKPSVLQPIPVRRTDGQALIECSIALSIGLRTPNEKLHAEVTIRQNTQTVCYEIEVVDCPVMEDWAMIVELVEV